MLAEARRARHPSPIHRGHASRTCCHVGQHLAKAIRAWHVLIFLSEDGHSAKFVLPMPNEMAESNLALGVYFLFSASKDRLFLICS